MKKILAFALFIIGSVAIAQLIGWQTLTTENAETYADDDADTSSTIIIGGAQRVTLRAYFSDSASVVYHFDYRVKGASAWTAVTAASADTIVKTAAGYSQIVLRDHSNERIPGVNTEFRIRAAFAASANSANSGATHTDRLEYK